MDWISLAKENDPLLLTNDQKHAFAAAALDYTFDQTSIFVGRDRAIQDLLAEFDKLCDLNKASVVSRRLNHFNVSNAQPLDYCQRVFEIESLGLVLAGIRYVGGNPEKPFVNLWPSFAIASTRDVDRLTKLATDRFKVFSPKEISFWLNPQSPLANELCRHPYSIRKTCRWNCCCKYP